MLVTTDYRQYLPYSDQNDIRVTSLVEAYLFSVVNLYLCSE